NIGGIKHIQSVIPLSSGDAELVIKADALTYAFYLSQNGTETKLGEGLSRYLSSEVNGGFTGVVIGFYAVGNNTVSIHDFEISYK
ncbi:MAG: glycoside hydrolase family 43 protein, partial [Lachnospiraceae bacterium]|nr:glycoside hydrolase family 43 protein [Lachnospiraceae bacterium]